MKRVYRVGEVYRHRNKAWQRRILEIDGDMISYNDGIGYGYCSKAHFGSMCPQMVEINPKSREIANELARTYKIYRETANGVYID